MNRILNTSLLILLTTQNILAFDINKLNVPENFELEIFVEDIEAPRQMAKGKMAIFLLDQKKDWFMQCVIMMVMERLMMLRSLLKI